MRHPLMGPPMPNSFASWPRYSRFPVATSTSCPASDRAGSGSVSEGWRRRTCIAGCSNHRHDHNVQMPGARVTLLRRCGTLVVALSVWTATTAIAQPVAPTISGQVLAADSDTPLRRARVAVAAGSRRSPVVLTDNDGRFVVEIPGAGTVPFTITVTKGGYVTASVKIERPDLRAPAVVRLPRGAAISGVAVDPTGAPVAGMPVTAARAGGAEAGTPAQYSSTTNDLGEYRIAGLAKGRYDVWAGATITALVPNPSGTGTKSMQVGAGEKTNVGVEAAEEVAGLQLVAPYTSPQDALAQIMRERGDTRISGTVADTVAVV